MTGRFSDTDLAAFLAGTLEDEAVMEAIENAINADPELAERVEALAREDDTAEAVRTAFAPVLAAPVPERLVEAASPREAGRQASAMNAASLGDLPEPANDMGGSWRWPQFAAMAASLAVGVLVGGPLLTGAGPGGDAGAEAGGLVLAGTDGAALSPDLAAMLDRAPSGEAIELGGQESGTVVLTFRNVDGQLCRQFRLDGPAGTSDALACALGDDWRIEAFGRRAQPAGEMRLAGGDAAVGVIAAVDEMIDSDPLVGPDEAAQLEAR
ncbi:hypothetical protein [Erythrobacter sp.]|uniref:anti-sigma factor family protein n=1 Tax=Erythrobacter sp. TaxID=1042 RepID=UPI001425F632|nr:hypothetical protein [Erythrobacter sp.]QIQ85463.1 MAG: hypothetical protein G9473_01285 [Erythrobacter sp.]